MTPPPLPVRINPGVLPAFWDRQVVFVANLLGLFFGNEDGTRALAREVGEVDSYGGRLLPILNLLFKGGENLLILERAPDQALADYFGSTLGLSLPTVEVLPHQEYLTLRHQSLRRHPLFLHLQQHPARWLDGYVTDDTLSDLAAQLGKQTVATGEGSRRGNNKRLLHDAMAVAGLPTPPTFHAGDIAAIVDAMNRLRAMGFRRAVVKSAVGASGIGLTKLPLDQPMLPEAVSGSIDPFFFFEGECLVQGWLEPGVGGVRRLRSPSVQIFVGEHSADLYDITEQILSNQSVHEGNEAPPPYIDGPGGGELRAEMLEKAAWAARWLHRQGYRGTGSADFLWIESDDGRVELQICELNARVTGATYPSVLARRFLPQDHWLLRNLRLEHPLPGADLLHTLDKAGCLFKPGDDSGVLPVNFNFGTEGLVHKGQFLCLGRSPEQCRDLIDRTHRVLPCAPDRD